MPQMLMQKLATMIQEQGITPGHRLPAERKLCEMLDISRATLREVLKQLNAQGLLQTKIGSGTVLLKSPDVWGIDFNLDALDSWIKDDRGYCFDVHEARAVLEGAIARYAAIRATDEDRQRIHQAYQQLQQVKDTGDANQALEADVLFHLAVAEASHNVVLIQMMRNILALLQHNVAEGRRTIYANQLERLNHQHAALIQAIDERNPDMAFAAMSQHIHYVIDAVKEFDEETARHQRKKRLL